MEGHCFAPLPGLLAGAECWAWGPAAYRAVGRLQEVKAYLVGCLALWPSLGLGKVVLGMITGALRETGPYACGCRRHNA